MNRQILEKLGMTLELERLAKGLCPTCGGVIGKLRDLLSEQEYAISGMCQTCQDATFKEID